MRKILSIDGGGIKGVFPASFLSTIEDSLGKRVSDHFDLIVGTSTGGIIALGLGLGFSAQEILDFYERFGPDIFKGNGVVRFLRSICWSKYSSNKLRESLEEKFGDRKLGESKNRLVIPALNLETGEVHVYKTSHNERLKRDYKEKAVTVAMATSAAPTYFPTFRSPFGAPLVDGGLWANNPVGAAVVEAIGVLDWPRDELQVLSIGCTHEAMDIKLARNMPMGKLYWGPNVIKLFMSSQSSASIGTAQLLAGNDNQYSNIIRVCPHVANKKFGLDVVKEIDSLKGMGNTSARYELPRIKVFFEAEVEPFVPFNKLNN